MESAAFHSTVYGSTPTSVPLVDGDENHALASYAIRTVFHSLHAPQFASSPFVRTRTESVPTPWFREYEFVESVISTVGKVPKDELNSICAALCGEPSGWFGVHVNAMLALPSMLAA